MNYPSTNKFRIFADASADMSPTLANWLPYIEHLPVGIHIQGKQFAVGPQGNLSGNWFYSLQLDDHCASVAPLCIEQYLSVFSKALNQGYDILYLGLSSGISSLYSVISHSLNTLKEQYPERVICLDYSASFALYWVASNCFAILQTLLLNHLFNKESTSCPTRSA